MSQMLPPGAATLQGPAGGMDGLAGLLAAGTPPGPQQQPQDDQAPTDPLSALQDVIESFPSLLHSLTDPNDVHMAGQAMVTLLAIQKRLMAQGAGGPSQVTGQ